MAVVIIICSFYTESRAQQVFRRHFLIAYDVSTPFKNAQKYTPDYGRALADLFSNKKVRFFSEADQNNLNIEKQNGLPFFDKNRDEISFYHFNIAADEMRGLHRTAEIGNGAQIVPAFNEAFLKTKHLNWSAYKKSNKNGSVDDYIKTLLYIPVNPPNFGMGVSMSNFVYPLILNRVEKKQYSEEYILIILSDFLTGSSLGNKKDLDRVKDIFQVSYSEKRSAAVNAIKAQIDELAAQYYKIDYFEYAFSPPYSSKEIAIIGYKIKPKAGNLNPEDLSLFIDGELSLSQNGYQSRQFKTQATQVKFNHNRYLMPDRVRLHIYTEKQGQKTDLFDDVVADQEGGNWYSRYTDDSNLMNFDSSRLTYFIPKLSIKLDSAINNRDFDNLKLSYAFDVHYQANGQAPLNLTYTTERNLSVNDIKYSTKVILIIMYFVIPVLAILLLIFLLTFYGRPIGLSFRMDGYLDSLEIIDYKTVGKLLVPYKAWDAANNSVDYLLVKGEIKFKSPNYLFNWNSPVYLKLHTLTAPPGFELFLKPAANHGKEFPADFSMTLKKEKDHKLSFIIGIRQNDITLKITDPLQVKFVVETAIKDGKAFIKADYEQKIEYSFYLGNDLEDVWMGFDPGTSGSCVAIGSSTDNIILGHDKISNIIPSVLVFEKSAPYNTFDSEIPEKIYRHGSVAKSLYPNTARYKGFQSLKKLLGFKDLKEIIFDNKNSLKLTGKELASLLIKGVFKDVSNFMDQADIKTDDYFRNGKFNPQRAVVAIPNNFTISKIQDMVDCIGKLNQFKEIRYVYEAEAVLFYYLSNFSKLNNGQSFSNSETILVFDMGGATINATVVTANKLSFNGRQKYDIDFLGKIGYGIGGDTIDYCIIKFILSFTDEFTQFRIIDVFDKKIALAELAFQIKKEIIANFNDGKEYLITAFNLQTFINTALGTSIQIYEDNKMYRYFLKNGAGTATADPDDNLVQFSLNTGAGLWGYQPSNYPLFSHPFFIDIIYKNVSDAVNEVIKLSNDVRIDKIVFSGRSTAFPMVKETVTKQLKVAENKTRVIALGLEESKTAVAVGACWYGINKNSVQLNNLKTTASFGFKKTHTADKTDVKFYELVGMGYAFNTRLDGISSFEGVMNITDDFAFDGSKVNFYQVMGRDTNKILAADERHKYSKIAGVNIDQVTDKVAMKVNENDEVDCAVILQSGRAVRAKGVVADQEIDEANAEHYTWIVK